MNEKLEKQLCESCGRNRANVSVAGRFFHVHCWSSYAAKVEWATGLHPFAPGKREQENKQLNPPLIRTLDEWEIETMSIYDLDQRIRMFTNYWLNRRGLEETEAKELAKLYKRIQWLKLISPS